MNGEVGAKSADRPPRPDDQGYCVLRLTDERVDVSALSATVAARLNRPRFEVIRELRTSRGFLARHVSQAQAEALLEDLRAAGVEAALLSEAEVVPLPAAERVRQIGLGPNGLYFGLHEVQFTVAWAGVVLVMAGRLVSDVEEVIRRGRDEALYVRGPSGWMSVRGNVMDFFDWTTTRRETRLIVDFYLGDPWRRLRVEEGHVTFALDGDAVRPSSPGRFEEVGRQLKTFGRGVLLNPGAETLGGPLAERTWRNLTFPDERHFDAYSLWHLQVMLRCGPQSKEGEG